ncbi:hypothetical protein CTEN210_13739 [Chaetoceros tenuissimus]|uniref:Uncharacterized protein n=1 Tax=Chaetoceros tenuissimus TaxID=426638 RepID=A0AAD3D3U1_9STRA|nr:hypothetical protein CTEN210_13739 [Chaetoceros tenuissimus]
MLTEVPLKKPVERDAGFKETYPAELIEENGETQENVKETAKTLVDELGPQILIANLGEGLGGKESTDLVQVFDDTIHEYSEAKIKESE